MALNREIYLDNAATTYCNGEVFYAMQSYFLTNYGNPNSLHQIGYTARKAIQEARVNVAKIINAAVRSLLIFIKSMIFYYTIIKKIKIQGHRILCAPWTIIVLYNAWSEARLCLEKHCKYSSIPLNNQGFWLK